MPKCKQMTIEIALDGPLSDAITQDAERMSADLGAGVTPEQVAHRWLRQYAVSAGMLSPISGVDLVAAHHKR